MTDEVHFNTSDGDELMETKEIGRERANDIINIIIEFGRTEICRILNLHQMCPLQYICDTINACRRD